MGASWSWRDESQESGAEELWLKRRVRSLARRLCASRGHRLNQDAIEDCVQCARLALWRAHPRLLALPLPVREPYAQSCIAYSVCRVIREDFRAKWLEAATGDIEGAAVPETGRSCSHVCASMEDGTDRFPDCIDRPDVRHALTLLTASDLHVLQLYYGEHRSDAELGTKLGISHPAAKMRRTRALDRMRFLLGVHPARTSTNRP
jgi:RNA polymerase sigma factor (sigma-70 family)